MGSMEPPSGFSFCIVFFSIVLIFIGSLFYDNFYTSITVEQYDELSERFPERRDDLTRRFFDKLDSSLKNDEKITKGEYSTLKHELNRIDQVNANNRLRYKYMAFKDKEVEK